MLLATVPSKTNPLIDTFSIHADMQNNLNDITRTSAISTSKFEILDFETLEGNPCPCGIAKRGFMEDPTLPYSLHLTSISAEAKTHYHRQITETYFILSCDENAKMELDGECFELRPNMSIVIRPGTRHRAIGEMQVIIVASPKFDPSDEWFD